jgi:hypothetical protein
VLRSGSTTFVAIIRIDYDIKMKVRKFFLKFAQNLVASGQNLAY